MNKDQLAVQGEAQQPRSAEAIALDAYKDIDWEARTGGPWKDHIVEIVRRSIEEATAQQRAEVERLKGEMVNALAREERVEDDYGRVVLEMGKLVTERNEAQRNVARHKAYSADMERSLEYAGKRVKLLQKKAAEQQLQALLVGMRGLPRYSCDCLPNDATDTRMATDEEAMGDDCIACQRAVVLGEDVERLISTLSAKEQAEKFPEMDHPGNGFADHGGPGGYPEV